LKVGDEDIRQLNVPRVRSSLGLVSQEPVLFNRSIADNIKYGDNTRDVSMEEVVTAARKEGHKKNNSAMSFSRALLIHRL
jgi:ABC-type multidrug transport system fused ATPase/permease subunit